MPLHAHTIPHQPPGVRLGAGSHHSRAFNALWFSFPKACASPVPNKVQTPSRHHQHTHTAHICTRRPHTLALPTDEEMRSFLSRSWVHTCPRQLCGSSLWTAHRTGVSCSCSALTAAQDKRHRPTFCFTPSLLSFWLESFRGSFWIPIRINFLTFA